MKQFFTRKHSLFLALFLCMAKLSSAQLPYMVRYLNVSNGATPNNLTNVNGILYFTAYDENYAYGEELWRSDGTAEGTFMVKDINPGGSSASIPKLTNINGTLFFMAYDGTAFRLWKSDGTAAGTVMVGSTISSSGNIINLNGTALFIGSNSTYGAELWKSDGTAEGTSLVKDINPGTAGSFIYYPTSVGGTLYFRATYNNIMELWKSDGTPDGTILLKQFSIYADLTNLTDVNGTLFFTVDDGTNGKELWKSNGTPEGTTLVKDIYPGTNGSAITQVIGVGNTAYFTATHPDYGRELWKSDGNEAGTMVVKDIITGASGADPQSFVNVSGTVFFIANDGINGWELWKTNGSDAGTVLVKDVYPGITGASITNLTDVNGTLYFWANTLSNGHELWKSDGSDNGTVLVKDINPGYNGSVPYSPTNVDGKLFFLANATIDGVSYTSELWALGTCTSVNKIIDNSGKAISYNSQIQTFPATTTCHCDVFNNLIATTDAIGNNPVSGNIISKVWIETTTDNYVRRHHEVYPESNPENTTAKVTLYFTQADFDAYNAAVAADIPKLPTDSADTAGISSIMIEKREGISEEGTGLPDSYSGAVSPINPDDADIVWNDTGNRWEVSFATTGFGGFFLKSPALITPSDVSVSSTTICSGETISLSGTCNEGTLNWYTSASGGSSIGTSSPFSISPTITTTYYAACEYGLNSTSRVATSEVVVTTMPTAPESVSIDRSSICSGTSVSLAATCPIGTVKWYTQLSGGSVINTGSSIQESPAYNTTYYVACENGDCKTARIWVADIIVADQPGNPTSVSIDQTNVCSSWFVSFSASCDYGTATWYEGEYDQTSVGTGNWGEVPGITTTYYVACENGDCKSERVLAGTVNVKEQPVNPTDVTVSETAICSGTSITLSAFCSVGDVAWYKIGEEEDVFLETGSIITQTPLVTTKYYAICINGICESGRVITSQVVVTTTPSKPTEVSTSKTAICSGTSITLMAACASGTLTWYNDSVADTSIGTGSGLTITPTDTYTYYATCINGDCKSEMANTDMVVVTTQPTNPTNISVDKSVVCSGEPVTLSANCSVGEVTWYSSATAATALGTGNNFDHSPTENTIYYAACENGICKSERVATEEVTVRPTPAKPTNLSQWSITVCSGMSNSLSGSCASGTLKWYDSATATTPAYEGGTVYISINKTTTFYAACETSYCSSERVAMEEMVFYTKPVNPTGLAVNKTAICNGESITLTGSCSIGNIQWIRAYTTEGVEQYDLVPTYTPTETSVYYAYCINGTCISDYLPTETVVVTEQPTSPTDVYQGGTELCEGTGVYVFASCSMGTPTWYDSSAGGTALGTGDSFIVRPTITTTYYVACENGNCKSNRVATSQIVVYQQVSNPTGVAVSKTAICNGEKITLSGSCLVGTLHWYKTSLDSDTAFTYAPKVNTVYHATCTNGPCFSETVSTAEVVVTQQPSDPTNVSVSSTAICKGESITLTATCALGTITWYNSSTGNTIIGTDNNLSQSPTVTTKYYAACVNGICNSRRVITNEVLVKAKPVTPVISGRNAICAGESVTLSASAPANNPDATFHWSGGATGMSLIASPASTTNYRAVATYDGCNSDSSSVFTVTVNRVPGQPGITADNATICKGNTVILTGQCLSTTDSFYWSNSAVSNGDAPAGYYKATRQITEPGTYKGWCESNTGCRGAEKTITITAGTNCGGKNFITITPAKPVVCPGSSVTLTAAGCTGTISWLGGVSTLTGTAISVSPTASTTYFVQCSTGGSATVDVTVVASAVVMSTNITIGNEIIKSVNSIESDKKIGDPNFSPSPVVTFEAGKSILLKPGFVADSRSVFTAQIKGCN